MTETIRRYVKYFAVVLVLGGLLMASNRFGCESHPAGKTGIADYAGGSTVVWTAREPVVTEYAYGDIIVYRPPNAPDTIALGRLVGLPGDRIAVRDGAVWRDGEALADDFGSPGNRRESRPPMLIPAETLYVLGDRSTEGYPDSRVFGPIAIGSVRGAAVNVE